MTRELAGDVVRTLQRAGHEAVWAGGCVRDSLLGRVPDDYDVATDASPARVREVFGPKRTLAVGEAFGVIIVLGARNDQGHVPQVEVATFRTDGQYSDGRRPDSISYCTAAEDARRRDFTINALFLDPAQLPSEAISDTGAIALRQLREAVVDHVGGLADFDARLIRAVGTPSQRFEEDRLRMLRAVRFAQRLGSDYGFTLEADTRAAIVTHAPAITAVSWERITQELTKMLQHPARADGFALLSDVGLAAEVLPECNAEYFADLQALGRVPMSVAIPLAMLLRRLPVGSPRQSTPAHTVRAVLERMKVSNALRDEVVWLIQTHPVLLSETADLATIKPSLADPRSDRLLTLASAIAVADGHDQTGIQRWQRYYASTSPEVWNPLPLVKGSDLIEAGLKPGPRFKQHLETVRNAQLNEIIATREEAVELLRNEMMRDDTL